MERLLTIERVRRESAEQVAAEREKRAVMAERALLMPVDRPVQLPTPHPDPGGPTTANQRLVWRPIPSVNPSIGHGGPGVVCSDSPNPDYSLKSRLDLGGPWHRRLASAVREAELAGPSPL